MDCHPRRTSLRHAAATAISSRPPPRQLLSLQHAPEVDKLIEGLYKVKKMFG
jgi:hypothetical protein